jgi:hypothetical protein
MFYAAVIALVGAFVCVLVPGGEDHAHRRGISLLVSLSVLAALAETAVRALPSAEEIRSAFEVFVPETETAREAAAKTEEWIVRDSIGRIERGAALLIAARFSVPAEEVRVSVHSTVGEDGSVTLIGAEILCSPDAALPHAAEEFAGTLLGCPCTVKEDGVNDGDVEASVEG